MRSNAVEACEQCGVLAVPAIDEPVSLEALLAGWQASEGTRILIFCDEGEASQNPLAALDDLSPGVPLAVLVGPEGGFSEEERALLRVQPFVVPMPLGPRCCAPTRPPSPPLRWFRRGSATGTERAGRALPSRLRRPHVRDIPPLDWITKNLICFGRGG